MSSSGVGARGEVGVLGDGEKVEYLALEGHEVGLEDLDGLAVAGEVVAGCLGVECVGGGSGLFCRASHAIGYDVTFIA